MAAENSNNHSGKFAGWTNTNTNFGAIGDHSTGTVNLKPQKKTCRHCQATVGIDHPDNCQCPKEANYCGYCEEADPSRRTCTCQKPITTKTTSSDNQSSIRIATELLELKRRFLNNRSATIESLRSCCDILEAANLNKYAKREEISKAFAATGKLVSHWTVINIVEPIGDGFTVFNMRQKRKFAIQNSHAFQAFLTSEENNANSFTNLHQQLAASWQNSELPINSSFFTTRYRVYEIATNLWANKAHITVEDMKDAISALQTNYLDLQAELVQQEQSIKNLTEQTTNQVQSVLQST